MGKENREKLLISTHTPAWGVTTAGRLCIRIIQNFNSHARVGRDLADIRKKRCAKISTHTPAWGVTALMQNKATAILHFNSHARVGRDQ